MLVVTATAHLVRRSSEGDICAPSLPLRNSPMGTLPALSPHFTDEEMGTEKLSSLLTVPSHQRAPHPPNPGSGVCHEPALCPLRACKFPLATLRPPSCQSLLTRWLDPMDKGWPVTTPAGCLESPAPPARPAFPPLLSPPHKGPPRPSPLQTILWGLVPSQAATRQAQTVFCPRRRAAALGSPGQAARKWPHVADPRARRAGWALQS